MRRPGVRTPVVLAVAAAALVLTPIAWVWRASLLPGTYSVTEMGRPDGGGGPVGPGHSPAHGADGSGDGAQPAATAPTRSVTDLVADPDRPADVAVTLVARAETFEVSGRRIQGYTLNGASPGPEIRVEVGELVEVRLVNESVPDGVTLHWHGVDVPNAADGVAGVTQDAVPVGGEHTYRFVPDQAGSFWYHSHQVSHEQVRAGLLGGLVVHAAGAGPDGVDVLALSHLYGGVRTVNGVADELRVPAEPGTRARVRVVNTDDGAIPVWVTGTPLRLVAVDGTDLVDPTPTDRYVLVGAGGRADVQVTMPADGGAVRVHLGPAASVVLGDTPAPTSPRPAQALDLLTYGSPRTTDLAAAEPDRTFSYAIGRRPGFLDGRPGMWWTVNGGLYPDVPMFVVGEGDVVRMRITNASGEAHPMHLHGHHGLVLSRDGVPSTGSPWWVDSLEVGPGEEYELAFVADNPGIWMDHCHNLPHATQGLVAHLMYDGVTTPFRIGGPPENRPE